MNGKRAIASLLHGGIALALLGAAPAAMADEPQSPQAPDRKAQGGDPRIPAWGSSHWPKWRVAPTPPAEPQQAPPAEEPEPVDDAAQATATEPARPNEPFETGWWRSWQATPPRQAMASDVPGGPTVAQRAEERAAVERAKREGDSSVRLGGYFEFASAYAYASPGHWSQLRGRVDVAASGVTAGGHGFKFGVRADADAAYMGNHRYPDAVRRDQRADAMIREAYIDFDADQWAFRLGRQHVVWGEVVGMFIADVVSARDTREPVLTEFDAIRIPQWAVRAERFGESSHLEFVWIPYPSYDRFGEPGADFYPWAGLVPPGTPVRHVEPGHSLSATNWGARGSYLFKGWDMSAFYYRSNDVSPVLLLTPAGLEAHHDRISQLGATFSKDIGAIVLKGEAVHTDGRRHLSADPAAPYGVKPSATLDYAIGVDLPRGDWRLNAQLVGRRVLDYDPSFLFDRTESGYTLLGNFKLGRRLELEALYAGSFNRNDYALRPRLIWHIRQTWRATLGVDVFGGSPQGLFGRYDDNDRVYLETRYWF